MKKWILIVALLLAKPSFACEPCTEIFDLQKTIVSSDLIIVGKKEGGGVSALTGKAEWISVIVMETLKGDPVDKTIMVNSWDGMCDYGIVVDEEYIIVVKHNTYVMFLENKPDIHKTHQYDTVNYGCSVKSLKVERNKVEIEGRKISLDELKEMIENSG